MNKPITLLSAIAFAAMLSGTAVASPDDITMDVIDPSVDSVDDVTRHIELRDEDLRSDTSKDHGDDADHRRDDDHAADDDKDEHQDDMDDDKSDSKDDMEDSKDDMEDSKGDMEDSKDDMDDTKNDAHDNG